MKHTKTLGVFYRKDYKNEDEYSLFSFDATTSGMGYVKVCDATVSFETPDDFNPTAAQIDVLQRKEVDLRDEYNRNVAHIREQIGKLQALEFTAPAAVFEDVPL